MPYPSTPLAGPPHYSVLNSPSALSQMHNPSHRSSDPPASCLRVRSPLLSPRHHFVSIDSSHTPDGYFSVTYEGTTRTPGSTPQAGQLDLMEKLHAMEFRRMGLGLSALISSGTTGGNSVNGGGGGGSGRVKPGLRISDMPASVMYMTRGETSVSDGSEGTEGTMRAGATPGEERDAGMVGLGLAMGEVEEETQDGWGMDSEDEEARGAGERRLTPYPRDGDDWSADGDDQETGGYFA